MFSVDKMVKRSFYYIQLKKIQSKRRKGIPLQSNARQRNIMSSEMTITDFNKGLQDSVALLTQYWLIQIACNSKQLLLPRQEFTVATFEGRILCRSKGKSGLERASWLESLMSWNSSKAGQLKQSSRDPPCEVSLLWTHPYFLCSPAFSVNDKMSPEQARALVRLPVGGFLTVLAKAFKLIHEHCTHVWTVYLCNWW